MSVRSPESSNRVESVELKKTSANDRDKWQPAERHFIPSQHCSDRGVISLPLESLHPKAAPFHEESHHDLTQIEEIAVRDQIEQKLVASGFPLRNVECEIKNSKIVLSGYVSRYYHLQMTLRIVFSLSNGRQIVNNVEVLAAASK